MSKRMEDDETLYECECFRVVRIPEEDGSTTVSISFFDHGIDIYLSDEEFAHFAEALSGLQPLPYKEYQH